MKLFKISTLILLFIFITLSLRAYESTRVRAYEMIFWYPGEAGSTEDAQATLDIFFDYINKQLSPDKISGKYFNTVKEGLNFIKQARPSFGIVSFAAYTINKAQLKSANILLQTLPLPDGKPVENYVIVGKGQPPTDLNNITLYTKQPLTAKFVGDYIIPSSPHPSIPPKGGGKEGEGVIKIESVLNILPTLKDVSSGVKKGGVILQPMEYYTLKNLNQPWTKDLSVWHTSNPVSSAPLVVFGNKEAAQKVKDILLKMTIDPSAKEILNTLRFKGFTVK